MLFKLLKETRLKWRAAGLQGSAEKAALSDDDTRALVLAQQALETLDLCARKADPDAIAILLTSTVLLDKVSQRLNKECPRQRLIESLSATASLADSSHFAEARRWLQHRLDAIDERQQQGTTPRRR